MYKVIGINGVEAEKFINYNTHGKNTKLFLDEIIGKKKETDTLSFKRDKMQGIEIIPTHFIQSFYNNNKLEENIFQSQRLQPEYINLINKYHQFQEFTQMLKNTDYVIAQLSKELNISPIFILPQTANFSLMKSQRLITEISEPFLGTEKIRKFG